MDTPTVDIAELVDVTQECLTLAEYVYDDWYANSDKIDWWDFFDRLDLLGYCAKNMDSPAVKKIQRHIRAIRSQS